MFVTLKKLTCAALACAALSVIPAQAQCRSPRSINGRERRQQERIRQGIRSGELTRREAARLEAQQARIRVDEAYARRSGAGLSARERARLEQQLSRSSRNIYKQKHDEQDRN